MFKEISPLDGRYADRVGMLGDYFSEFALTRARCRVECEYLLAQEELKVFPHLNETEKAAIASVIDGFTEDDYLAVKEIEKTTRHDVKACEIFLRSRLHLRDDFRIHFALTSEDVNNLSWSILLTEALSGQILPKLRTLIADLCTLAEQHADDAYPARTHGQFASPSTYGKEFAVFAHRLERQYARLSAFRFPGKFNGATGNYSATSAAFPDADWPGFARGFVTSLGLEFNPVTTQIESHDGFAEFFDLMRHVNNIVADLDVDIWLAISYGYFLQKAAKGQVGSSTMPHKINPIRFENSEGNIEIANALLGKLSDRLTRSRLQRDLSDSTVQRNMGVAVGHSLLAWEETMKGLSTLEVAREAAVAELAAHPELLAEPLQTIFKTVGVKDPYELFRAKTQGRVVTMGDLQEIILSLEIPADTGERCLAFRPETYTGLAGDVTRTAVERIRKETGIDG